MEPRHYAWILQGLLAIIFIYLVVQTLTMSGEELALKRGTSWVNGLSMGWLRFIDVMEIAALAGLLLSIFFCS